MDLQGHPDLDIKRIILVCELNLLVLDITVNILCDPSLEQQL